MGMKVKEIEDMIVASIPDAIVEIKELSTPPETTTALFTSVLNLIFTES